MSDLVISTLDGGVLTLTLPKAEQSKPRQIKIGGPAQAQVKSITRSPSSGRLRSRSARPPSWP